MAPSPPSVFSDLPKLSRPEVALLGSFASYLSYRPFAPSFAHGLGVTLSEVLRQPVRLGAPTLSTVGGDQLRALLPQVPCIAQVGLAPAQHKLLVEIDPNLAACCVERMLGGDGEQANGLITPLTELEAGVLSYVLLQALHHFHLGWQRGSELGLVLDSLYTDAEQLPPQWQQAQRLVVVQIPVLYGARQGGVRILVPPQLVHEHFGRPPDQSSDTPQQLAYIRQTLNCLSNTEVVARLIIAHVELSPADIANVGAGDIIVLEQHSLKKTADGLHGQLNVRLGAGKNGGLTVLLRNDEGEADQLSLEVVQIMVQQQPPEAADADEPAVPKTVVSEPPDNLGQTAGLLRDIDAPVVVELGRLRMNTAQVVRLRAGQILKLNRGPSDPVDLVVGDKIFARGELIDVEGELGVRLTQVAGADSPA